MDILMLGGTRFFGIGTVKELLKNGHNVTIATRGKTADDFGKSVDRIVYERSDRLSNMLREKQVKKPFFVKTVMKHRIIRFVSSVSLPKKPSVSVTYFHA